MRTTRPVTRSKRWQRIALVGAKLNGHEAVARTNKHGDTGSVVGDGEICQMMLARKDASACEMVEPGAGVAARDKHTLACFAGRFVPQNGNTMSRVLAGDTAEAGKPTGTNLLQADKTDAGDCIATLQLGAERPWQKTSHNLGIHPEVDEQPAADQTIDYWKTHGRNS